MQRKEQLIEPSPDTRGAVVAPPHRGQRPSAWMPPRRSLVPVALPRRFVEGVAWDDV